MQIEEQSSSVAQVPRNASPDVLPAAPEASESVAASSSKTKKQRRKREEGPKQKAVAEATIKTVAPAPALPSSALVPAVERSLANETTRKAERKAPKPAQRAERAPIANTATTIVRTTTPEPSPMELSPPKPRSGAPHTRSAAQYAVRELARQSETKSKAQSPSWTLSPPTAGRFLPHDPIFVRDETGIEYLLSATARDIQVLSLDSSLLVRTILAPHGLFITSFATSTADSTAVCFGLSDGQIMRSPWNVEGTPTRAFMAAGAVQAISCVPGAANGVRAEQCLYIANFDGRSGIFIDQSSQYVTKRPLEHVIVLGDFDYIVAYGSRTIVIGTIVRADGSQVQDSSAEPEFAWIEIPTDFTVTCLDARILSPASSKPTTQRKGLSLAVGTNNGAINLYSDVSRLFYKSGGSTLPDPRVLHWHRDAASSAKFSRDGNYLVSGGKETVLVLWQLATGKQQFLPHLTSEIERIVVSPVGDRYAVQMGDNSIMVLSTSELKPVANFAGLQMAARNGQVVDERPIAAVLHSLDAQRLLVAVPSTQPKSAYDIPARSFLQAFDLRNSRHVARQALTRNNVTDFNLGPEGTPIDSPDVTAMAISKDGQWLATIDTWMPPTGDLEHLTVQEDSLSVEEEQCKRREVYLKIWNWNATQGLWTLSTRFDAPHSRSDSTLQGAGTVFALAAEPNGPGFATVGEDGRVKIWKPKTRMRGGVVMTGAAAEELVEWRCRHVIELPTADTEDEREDSPMDSLDELVDLKSACLAFADHGTTLAATLVDPTSGVTPVIHFIDAITGKVSSTKHGWARTPTVALGFLDRYFIAVDYEAANVWDLVTDTLQQRYKLPEGMAKVAFDRAGNSFAVAIDSNVMVFKPTLDQPHHKMQCDEEVEAVLAGSGRGYTLLLADATIRTLSPTGLRETPKLIAPAEESALQLDVREASPEAMEIETTSLQDALAAPSSTGQDDVAMLEVTEDDRPVVRPEQLASIFDVAQSFALPPVRDMFEAVVGLYGRRPLARYIDPVAG